MIDHTTVTEYARYCALNDLSLALAHGEDLDGLAWGPEHTTALARYVGSTVSELRDEVGEDTWAELVAAAQDAYADWMRGRIDESRELRAEQLTDGWSVVDASGQRWWPTDEGQEYLATARDPAFEALRGCISGLLRGRWQS